MITDNKIISSNESSPIIERISNVLGLREHNVRSNLIRWYHGVKISSIKVSFHRTTMFVIFLTYIFI